MCLLLICTSVSEYYVPLCMSSFDDVQYTRVRVQRMFVLLRRAPVDCVGLLTRLPTAASVCEKLLSGPFNGGPLIWEKVAKSWEKRALSRWGREGVNHERTCL